MLERVCCLCGRRCCCCCAASAAAAVAAVAAAVAASAAASAALLLLLLSFSSIESSLAPSYLNSLLDQATVAGSLLAVPRHAQAGWSPLVCYPSPSAWCDKADRWSAHAIGLKKKNNKKMKIWFRICFCGLFLRNTHFM